MLRKKVIIDRERYDELKAMLEERRAEIQAKLKSLRETLPADNEVVKDAEEQSVDDYAQEVDFALMQMKSQTLAKIDDAVRRLERGRYGVCIECDREIAAARLKALPFAAKCRECQEAEEGKAAEEREARKFVSLAKDLAPARS
jgi:DnaK suppressor protein